MDIGALMLFTNFCILGTVQTVAAGDSDRSVSNNRISGTVPAVKWIPRLPA